VRELRVNSLEGRTSEPTVKRMLPPATTSGKLPRNLRCSGTFAGRTLAQSKRATESRRLELGDRIEAQLADDASLFNFIILLQDGSTCRKVRQFKWMLAIC
jgi:hypothetical protein